MLGASTQAEARADLREAMLAALVALGLFGPMIGLRTDLGDTSLILVPRPMAVALAVGLVFAGRLLVLSRARRPRAAVAAAGGAGARVGATRRRSFPRARRWLVPALLGFALLLPLTGRRDWIDTGILVMTYVMLGWGLNIVVGLAGLLDLGYVAFYAIGAYAYAIFSTQFGLGFWICLPIAGLLAGTFGLLLGFPVLRLQGDYLAIVTLAFGEIIRVLLINWVDLTNGPNGISDIPRPTLFGLRLINDDGPGTFAGFFGIPPSPTQRVAYLYYIILGLALLTNAITLRLRRLPLGRAWEALREDEIACRSLGLNVTVIKLTAFAVGALFAGFAGAFFATRQAFVSPESFTFIESATVLAIVVLGGPGSQLGVALAALIMIGGGELLRDLRDERMLIFGLVLVVVMVTRPRGLVSGRTPSVLLVRTGVAPSRG